MTGLTGKRAHRKFSGAGLALARCFVIWQNRKMSSFAKIAKALGDEGRVRIIRALDREKELCACQLTELLALAPSTVSKHLGILKQAGLLKSRREGTWIYYALNHDSSDKLVKEWLSFTLLAVRGEREYKEDKRKLVAIKRLDPEELCCKQRGR